MNKSLDNFIKRNKRRNSHLYQPGLIAGHDYVICPVSKERMSMIKQSYIERVLGMTIDQYDRMYPGARTISKKRKENIKAGLTKIDPNTGLTKYKLSQLKAKQTLNEIDPLTGLTGYKKKGQKTRATHMNRVDEHGRNGYRRQADARLTTILPNGLTVEQNAHIKQKESLIKKNKIGSGGASKLSKKVLAPLIDFLKTENIKYYFDISEFGIKDPDTGNYYFWDLTIPSFQMAIEYQSSAWHANPTLLEEEWKNWKPPRGKLRSADEVLEYDYEKARSLYKNRGFLTFYVWQKSENTDIEELLCLLKTLNMKS